MITDLSLNVKKWMFSRKLKEMIFSSPLWILGEPCFHRHSCWQLASISGRQLVREAWALPAGAKKLKLKLRGENPEAHTHNNQTFLVSGALLYFSTLL